MLGFSPLANSKMAETKLIVDICLLLRIANLQHLIIIYSAFLVLTKIETALSRSKIVDTALVRCQSFKFGKRFGKVINSFLVVPFVVIAQCHIRPKARVERVVAVEIVEQEQSLMVFGRLEIL